MSADSCLTVAHIPLPHRRSRILAFAEHAAPHVHHLAEACTASVCMDALPAADYSWSLRGLDGPSLAEAKSACHLRSARRLVDVAFANGAIYIKAGQHIGQLVNSACCP